MNQDQSPQYDVLTPQQRLKNLLIPEKRDLGIILGYGICSGVFALIIPIAVQTLVNTIAFGSLLQPILVLSLLVLLTLGVSAFLRGLQVYLMEKVQQRIFARTSLTLAHHIPKIKISAIEGEQGPELVNRFFDILTVQKSTALIMIDGLSIVLQTLVGMALLAFYHPILLAFDLFLVGLIFSGVFYLGQGAIKSSIIESKKKYEVANWLEILARVPIVFKKPQAQNFIFERSDLITSHYIKSRKNHFQILLRQIIGALSLQVLASSALLGLGGWLVVKRQLTLGQLVAAELIVTSVVTGVGKFGKYLESYYDLIAAADKLGYLMELPTEDHRTALESPSDSQKSGPASLSLVGLSYGDPSQPQLTLKQIELRVSAGEKITLYGGRSSGKSALCDLLYLLKEPQAGNIELDGISSKDMSLSQYRSQVSLLRSVDLFEGTLLENIRIHEKAASVEAIYSILEKLGVLEEIKRLPEGLLTKIMGGKSMLSSTQAKFIALARTLVQEPRLLIIDSFLDDLDDESKLIAMKVLLEQQSSTLILTTGSRLLTQMSQRNFSLELGNLTLSTGRHS